MAMVPPELIEKLKPTVKGGTVSVSLGSVALVLGWLWWEDRAEMLERLEAIEGRELACACLSDSDLLQIRLASSEESPITLEPAPTTTGAAKSKGKRSGR